MVLVFWCRCDERSCLVMVWSGGGAGAFSVEQRSHRESGGPEPAGGATDHIPGSGEEYAKPLESGGTRADAERAENVSGDGPGAIPGMPTQVPGG